VKITEVFDNPYTLTQSGPRVDVVKNALVKDYPEKCIVHQNVNNPDEFFIEVFNNGAWEIHHAVLTGKGDARTLASGIRLDQSFGPTPRYISTAKSLLQKHIDKGHSVRIQSTNDNWNMYKNIMTRTLKDQEDRYDIGPEENFKGSAGQSMIAQTLTPKNGKNLPEDFYKRAASLIDNLNTKEDKHE
jgi:hypothetical protein